MHRLLPLLAILLVAVFLSSGCLEAKRSTAVAYDPALDTFRVLRLYYDIEASTAEDISYLQALYGNRDHLLLYDSIAIMDESAAIRVNKNHYFTMNLGKRTPRPITPTLTELDLSLIQILPGKLFLSPDKTLCYYHQLIVPGKFVDQLLTQANTMLYTSLVEAIDAEIQRRKDGGTIVPWEEIQTNLLPPTSKPTVSTTATTDALADTQPTTEPTTQPAHDKFAMYLSDESLTLMRQATLKKSILLTRKENLVSFNFVLTPHDATQLQTFFTTLRKQVVQESARPENANNREYLDHLKAMLDQLAITIHPSGLVTAAAPVDQLLNGLLTVRELPSKPLTRPATQPAGFVERTRLAAREMRGQVDPSLHLNKILPAFQKDQLPTNPTDKPVEPGQDLFLPSPATAPTTAP